MDYEIIYENSKERSLRCCLSPPLFVVYVQYQVLMCFYIHIHCRIKRF